MPAKPIYFIEKTGHIPVEEKGKARISGRISNRFHSMKAVVYGKIVGVNRILNHRGEGPIKTKTVGEKDYFPGQDKF